MRPQCENTARTAAYGALALLLGLGFPHSAWPAPTTQPRSSPPPTLSYPALPDDEEGWIQGRPVSIEAISSHAVRFDASPALPAGVLLDPRTGRISGSPSQVTAKPQAYRISAYDAQGRSVSRILRFSVSREPQNGDPLPGSYVVLVREGADVDALLSEQALTSSRRYRHAKKGFSLSGIYGKRLERLRADPRVLLVAPDQHVSIEATTQSSVPSWGLGRIDDRSSSTSALSSYSYDFSGTGVTAYVIDTGINLSHNEFLDEFGIPRASYGFDAISSSNGGLDCNGHGTHVAGTIGGTTTGVAKTARLVAVRVLDCNGSGSMSGVIAGIDWVIANRQLPAVANLSLGSSGYLPVDMAVQRLVESGVTVVVAAGNSSADASNYTPARTINAVTVGATGVLSSSLLYPDNRASYSNYGQVLDLYAPGTNITSAWIGSTVARNTISGTSMASPHAAGIAALYLQNHPTATPKMVRDALVSYSSKNRVLLPRGSKGAAGYANNLNISYSMESPDSTSSTTLNIDGISPMLSITSHSNGQVISKGSSQTFVMNASDNVGISSVRVRRDGAYSSALCKASSPFSAGKYRCSWTAPSTPQQVIIDAVAVDSRGNETATPFLSLSVQ